MTDAHFQLTWAALHLSAAVVLAIVVPAAILAHLGSSRYHMSRLLRLVNLW